VAKKADNEDPLVRMNQIMKALLLISLGSMKQRQQIETLAKAGFGRAEIAELVGSTANAVGVRLAEMKKGSKSRKGE